jgi:hypothetical protein
MQTVMTAMQQSVKAHKHLYGDFGDPSKKEIITQREKMTAVDKRKIEILLKVFGLIKGRECEWFGSTL